MFILNPKASGFNKFDYKKEIEKYLKEKNINFDYEIKTTTYPKEAIEISKNAIKDGFNELIAVGGDGTINEVGDVARKNNLKLGIIPAGTGNDYCNSLKKSTNFNDCMDKINIGNYREVDYGLFLDKTFFNVLSVGFDAEVNRLALKIKKYIKNSLSYKLAIVLALIKYKRKRYKVIVDNKEYIDDFFLIAIGIGGKYGGNINILPKAEIDDGLFDVCMIKYKSKFNIIKKVKTIIDASHIKEDITLYKKAKSVTIITDNLEINYDGEYMKTCGKIEFTVGEGKMKILL